MDFKNLLKDAKGLQESMEALDKKLETVLADGLSGGGLVCVTLNGKGIVKGVKVDESLLTPSEKGVLEDLLVAAFNDAKNKTEEVVQQELMANARNFNLPF